MDADVKVRWLAALRSGDYEQGKRCLRRKDHFCCLGVLCDIVDPGGWVQGRGQVFAHRDLYAEGVPTDSLLVQVGLLPGDDDDDWVGPRADFVSELTGMNDGGFSFREIADVIEERA